MVNSCTSGTSTAQTSTSSDSHHCCWPARATMLSSTLVCWPRPNISKCTSGRLRAGPSSTSPARLAARQRLGLSGWGLCSTWPQRGQRVRRPPSPGSCSSRSQSRQAVSSAGRPRVGTSGFMSSAQPSCRWPPSRPLGRISRKCWLSGPFLTTVFKHPSELAQSVGQHLGYSDWLEIDQQRINLFADATGDHQWIHVDPERAKDGPFGKCIAHGYLSLSLVNLFLPQIVDVQGIAMGVNYGCDRVRFPAAVPVGSRLRGGGELVSVEEVRGGAIQAVIRVTVEIEGSDRPACVVDTISRYFPESV